MVAIVDYGVGNLFSLRSSFQSIGVETVVTSDPAVLHAADRIVLPGVGAFGDAKAQLEATGLVPVLLQQAAAGKPVAAFSSLTSCQELKASRKLMKPGRPLSTWMGRSLPSFM